MPDVVVVGSANVDSVIRADSIPAPGQTVLGDSAELRPGGKGANQAAAAALYGASTRLIAGFGDDRLGQDYIEGLREIGLDTAGCVTIPGSPTGRAFVSVDREGENSIIVVPGANARLDLDTVLTHLGNPAWVLLQLEISATVVKGVIEEAHRRGSRVALNPSPLTGDAAELARLADLVIANQHEAEGLEPHDNVCITRGADEVVWGADRALPPRVAAIDTTGAGDAFAGTLVAALARGVSRRSALEHSVKASAASVQRIGAQPWSFAI